MKSLTLGICLSLMATGVAWASPPDELIDLRGEIDSRLALVKDPERFRADNAIAIMEEAYTDLYELDPATIDFKRVVTERESLTFALMGILIALDGRMAEFYADGAYTLEMAMAKRKVVRAVRFLMESVLIWLKARLPKALYEFVRPALAKDSRTQKVHWTVNPAYQDLRLEDYPRTFLIASMGNSTTSAAIARSTDEDSMWSHMSVGYVSTEPHTIEGQTYEAGTVFTIEAHIEDGVKIAPIGDHFLKQVEGETVPRSVREAIFFNRNPQAQECINQSADAFFHRVKGLQNAGTPLGYDFKMGTDNEGATQAVASGTDGLQTDDPETTSGLEPGAGFQGGGQYSDLTEFFCSQVAAAVWDPCGVPYATPPSLLKQGEGSRQLFDLWGIKVSVAVPAPGDIDSSASVVRVAEGRAIDAMPENHMRQLVLVKIFEWMDRLGYQLHTPWYYRLVTWLPMKWNESRILPDFGLIPSGISFDITKSFIALTKSSDRYLAELKRKNAEHIESEGRPMTPREMKISLEQIREIDYQFWLDPPRSGEYDSHGNWVELEPPPGKIDAHEYLRPPRPKSELEGDEEGTEDWSQGPEGGQ